MGKISQQVKATGVYREAVKKALDIRNRLINQANEEYRKARQTARARYDREVKGG